LLMLCGPSADQVRKGLSSRELPLVPGRPGEDSWAGNQEAGLCAASGGEGAMVRAAREGLVGAWRRILRRPSSRTEALTRRERRYAGAKAAEQAERARQARADQHPDIRGNMGAGGFGGSG
jgi:hypothetical protein